MEHDERNDISSDLLGTVVRPPSIRISGSFKSSLSGRLTPRNSPSFRRSPSLRASSAKEFRSAPPVPLPWYKKLRLNRKLLPWLIAICIWAYFGLLLQSRWSRTEDHGSLRSYIQTDQDDASRLIIEEHKRIQHVSFPHNTVFDSHPWDIISTAKASSWNFPSVGIVNTTVGTLVGPFQHLEESILSPIEELTSCSPLGTFASYAHGRTFLLVFHELSMTGSPLALFELGKDLLGCGAKVIAVALSQKGGLLQELLARKFKVLKSKSASTFKSAAKVDLIVAGSAVCASWIERFELENKRSPNKLVWWIMENRREYFDRSKHMLGSAKGLIFLSEVQSKQWLSWARSEGILLPDKMRVIPLCVNAELSIRAGLYASTVGRALDTQKLRDKVREEMGLKPEDVLLSTLGSINPGKGQLKLIQALDIVVEDHVSLADSDTRAMNQKIEGGSRIKLLIGSVGSKSNKVDYIQKILDYVGDRPYLGNSLLWTPSTVHVASLYAASDIYVMNSQGLGETFGRVTIEAMAFALPILGTSAGGTLEIVQNRLNGLLHPVGADGVHVLAEHIRELSRNKTLRQEMGLKGSEKVREKFLKGIMYESMVDLFSSL
ncbi:hypothetical protein KP509_07G022100 [Ceratopteris richardii]|uniref:Glycosyl transferase family 1 domain-containing protein n=1 Tax=Ceratopteris richardii TaxID=49495 RepID=A0A8T2U861_CERRI|nr:hypothetical protein KP509_07G022100 [Ceratopteris richardii]